MFQLCKLLIFNVLCALVFLLCWPSGVAAADFTTLDVPGATCTSASKINNRGQIVGWYCDGTDLIRSFLWRKGEFVTLTAVPGTVNSAAGINNQGDIVGSYIDDNGIAHGYLLENGILTSIEFPGAIETSASDINDESQIVGTYLDAGGTLHGFLLADGNFTSIEIPSATYSQALGNDGEGRIVGFYVDSELLGHGFIWDKGAITALDHADASLNTAAYDINARDDIVGFQDGQGESTFVLRNSKYRMLKFPSFVHDPLVLGINDKRQIVGEYFDGNGNFHGFLMRRPAYIPNRR
jgi:uncharacterized membrane protein